MKKSTVTIFLFAMLYQNVLFAKADPNNIETNNELELKKTPRLILDEPTSEPNQIFSKVNPDEQLLKAIEDLDPNRISIALDAGANPNMIDSGRNRSVLSEIIMRSSLTIHSNPSKCYQMLQIVFNAGAKLQWCDYGILFFPISDGDVNTVELLLNKGANPDAKIDGMTPVEWAEAYGQQSVVEVLVKHGAKPVPKRQALQNRFVKLAGESYKKTEFGEQQNIIEMVKALENGARVDETDSAGRTALCEAMLPSDLEEYLTIVFLLQEGANPNLESAQTAKETAGLPLHHAVVWMSLNEKKDGHLGMKVYSRLAVEALLKAGANVSSRGYNGQTPLHIAAKYNGFEAAEMLIKEGSKVMDKDDSGKTPLDYAESAEMIKLLKSHGAKE